MPLCPPCRGNRHAEHTSKVRVPREQRGQHLSHGKVPHLIGRAPYKTTRIADCDCAECTQEPGWRGTPQPVPKWHHR